MGLNSLANKVPATRVLIGDVIEVSWEILPGEWTRTDAQVTNVSRSGSMVWIDTLKHGSYVFGQTDMITMRWAIGVFGVS